MYVIKKLAHDSVVKNKANERFFASYATSQFTVAYYIIERPMFLKIYVVQDDWGNEKKQILLLSNN